jgi:L-cysteine S-thiosulfotransferase
MQGQVAGQGGAALCRPLRLGTAGGASRRRRRTAPVRQRRGPEVTMRLYIALLAPLALLAGCAPNPVTAAAEFRLPTGDPEAGRKAFVELRCYVCHEVPGIDAKFEGTPAAHVVLGGTITRVKTYAELVTSIINPTHKVPSDRPGKDAAAGASVMSAAGLNDVMTVTQLVDLVSFLQPTYKVEPPKYDPYAYKYRYYYH